jgi:ERCC4-related helicase
MQKLRKIYRLPAEVLLGSRLVSRLPEIDQIRQRKEAVEILKRFRMQPGVVLADEVGMGKTFVALAVAYSVAMNSPKGPAIIMAPANLVGKWERDLKTFAELYLENRTPLNRAEAYKKSLKQGGVIRYAIARHSIDLLRLLDDAREERCHLIFLAQGAMARSQTDRWVRLALIAESLRKHGRGGASKLIKVKRNIHRFLGELLWAVGEERAHGLGDVLWERLMRTDPRAWKKIYNGNASDHRKLDDDPVPKSVTRQIRGLDLKELANALQSMPIRATGGGARISERLRGVRAVLKRVEEELWKRILAKATWRSPLLVMDEAHHLKNPMTALARQLQSPDLNADLKTGDGAMSRTFDRMLFLTATPFQLGHTELIRVLRRFGDVRWNGAELGEVADFHSRLTALGEALTESQRSAIAFHRSWNRLTAEDCNEDMESWWRGIQAVQPDQLKHRQRAVLDAFRAAKARREQAEQFLKPWIIRNNKPDLWQGTDIPRRRRITGAAVNGGMDGSGLDIPSNQLLPFFLAARSAMSPHKDLLGEALSSSFEAFRFTREHSRSGKDDQYAEETPSESLAHVRWYLSEFDTALKSVTGGSHPKIHATVQKVLELWEKGEKVLVFAFYQQTCGALRIHISNEIQRRLLLVAQERLVDGANGESILRIDKVLDRIQERFFDDTGNKGRKALDAALHDIMGGCRTSLAEVAEGEEQSTMMIDVMRRFLRVRTTLVRSFPISELDFLSADEAVSRMLSHADGSGLCLRKKFQRFLEFLTTECSAVERRAYLEAALGINTGEITVHGMDDDTQISRVSTLANVQVATGKTQRETRSRLMMAFNTPFFPDILVCSQVMGEGVDLQRYCRHVIHHDLAWNPSDIEQRTGRIDRIGCKAEGQQPIHVYLPYIDGSADERQFRVMSDRERWFRVVMGQEEVARLVAPDSEGVLPLPKCIESALHFQLSSSVE